MKSTLMLLPLLAMPLQIIAEDFTPFVIPAIPGNASSIAFTAAPVASDKFMRIEDSHFFLGKERFRVWGVNLCFSANFPTHETAEKMAARLAASGINSVRFHHTDTSPYPNGIWDPKNPGKMSAEAVDRLDYLIDQLAKQGIYANINLHVGHSHARTLKLPDAEKTPHYDKMIGIFTPVLIDAQKEYARTLLTHTNIYRKLRYVDDPAVAFVEISNEDSLFMWGADSTLSSLPPYYSEILEKQFSIWLKKRYSSTDKLRTAWRSGTEPQGTNQLTNGDLTHFENGRLSNWNLEQHFGCKADIKPLNKERSGIRIEIQKNDTTNWHLQITQTKLDIKAGRPYTLQFRARSDKPRSISIGCMQAHDPWKNLGLSREEDITTEWQTFTRHFISNNDETNARVGFSLGKESSAVEIADVQFYTGDWEGLTKDEALESANIALYSGTETPARTTDRSQFLAETEKAYFDNMRTFLKKDLGCKALITGTIVFGPISLYTQSDMDYIDGHAYWQHPSFPGRPWDPNNWLIGQKAMVDDPAQSTLMHLSCGKLNGKPYTVSEYNHPAPNDYQAECVPIIASFTSAQDWDGIWLFAYQHRTRDKELDKFESFFDIDANPSKWGFIPAGSHIFRNSGIKPLEQSRTIPLISSVKELPKLASIQNQYSFAIPKALAEQKSFQWQDLLKTGLSLSISGKQISSKSSAGTAVDWQEGKNYVVKGSGAWVQVGHSSTKTDVSFAVVKEPSFTAITVTSQDGQPLEKSHRILITSCGRSENVGMNFSADRRTVGTAWGQAPVQIQPVDALITLPVLAKGKWECCILGPDGVPTSKKPIDVTKPISISAQDKTMWHLLVRE